jgi:hypothetical protein
MSVQSTIKCIKCCIITLYILTINQGNFYLTKSNQFRFIKDIFSCAEYAFNVNFHSVKDTVFCTGYACDMNFINDIVSCTGYTFYVNFIKNIVSCAGYASNVKFNFINDTVSCTEYACDVNFIAFKTVGFNISNYKEIFFS